jgi:hypothetical protein
MFREKTARRAGVSRVEAVVMVFMAVLMMGLATSCARRVREVVVRTQTANSLKQTTLATHSCNDVYKKLPPAFDKFGVMLFPAAVHIHLLPFVEKDDLYKLYLKLEGKGAATDEIVPAFIAPHDKSRKGTGAGVQNHAANLRVFADKGLETAYDADMRSLGFIEPGTASIPRSFSDGTSNTIAFATKFAECGDGGSAYVAAPASKFAAFFGQNAAQVPAHPSDVTATFQLAPAKHECRPTPLLAQSFGDCDGISVSLFDGSVRVVSRTISTRTWNLAVQPNDNLKLGADWEQ